MSLYEFKNHIKKHGYTNEMMEKLPIVVSREVKGVRNPVMGQSNLPAVVMDLEQSEDSLDDSIDVKL